MKKGAIFGLDARIALAIFGSLSVISGAALYSAIQDAKVTAIIADMNEVGKAWESYYLDTGKNLSRSTNDINHNGFYTLSSGSLINDTSNTIGWKGPYLPYILDSTGIKGVNSEYIFIVTLTDEETWGGAVSWQSGGKCTSGKSCFISIMFNSSEYTPSLLNAIDKKIDTSDGSDKGKIRWWVDSGVYRLHMQYAPIKNPHD
tara:strand:- start:211 stop:816 length:606 start_codon:yes stop_codon:yes gene_type:complete